MTEWGIDTLFNPGKRHMDEEKRRLQSTREEVGDSSGGRRIDFEAGTVTISRRGATAPAAEEATSDEATPEVTADSDAAIDSDAAPDASPDASPEGDELVEDAETVDSEGERSAEQR